MKKLLVLVLVLCLFGMCGCTMVATDTAGYSGGISDAAFSKVFGDTGGYFIDKISPSNPNVIDTLCATDESGSVNVFWFKCKDVNSAKHLYSNNVQSTVMLKGKQQMSETADASRYYLTFQTGDTVLVALCGISERDTITSLVNGFVTK